MSKTSNASTAATSAASATPPAPQSFPRGRIRIHRIIAHQVFSPDDKGNPVAPHLSTGLTTVTSQAEHLLSKRIADALGKRSFSFPIVFTNTSSGSFYDVAMKSLARSTDKAFIAASQKIAGLLGDSQTRRDIPAGILIVIQAQMGPKKPILLVFKCEKQEGFTGKIDSKNNTIIEVVTDLLLTPAGKLYKVCALVGGASGGYSAFLFDGGVTRKKAVRPVQYFASSFLGAQLAADGRIETFTFHQAVLQAVNELPVLTEKKLELKARLETFLTPAESTDGSKPTAFTAEEFVQNNIDQQFQDQVRQVLAQHKVPDRAIVRDTIDIDSKLGKGAIDFGDGLKLVGPNDQLGRVTISEEEEGVTILRIPVPGPEVK